MAAISSTAAAGGGGDASRGRLSVDPPASLTKAQKAEARERAEALVLSLLKGDETASIDTYALAADTSNSCSNTDLEAAVKSLHLDGYVAFTASSVPEYFLTPDGEGIEASGQSPELELFGLVPAGEAGIPMKELKAAASPLAFKSLKDAQKAGLLASKKGVVIRALESAEDPFVGILRAVKADKSFEPPQPAIKRKFVKSM